MMCWVCEYLKKRVVTPASLGREVLIEAHYDLFRGGKLAPVVNGHVPYSKKSKEVPMSSHALTRRNFIQNTAIQSTAAAAMFAGRLFPAPSGAKKPNPELENLGAVALGEAGKLKASYCDIRIIRYQRQMVSVRLNPERGTGKTLEVPFVSNSGSFGFGVRVILNGVWGF